MRRVFAEITRETEELKAHDVFLKIKNISSAQAIVLLKAWGPLFVHQTMTFRDINLMYNVYENPKNDLEFAINSHAFVDATHWEMLITDLEKLGASSHVKNYRDALSVIWSQQGEPIRDYMYWVLHRALLCGSSPLLKIAAMESCESTVKTFLIKTRHISQLFSIGAGAKLDYFGDSHFDSEVENSVNLSIFEEQEIDEATLATALWIVKSHFENFKVFVNHLFGYLEAIEAL